MSFHTGNFKNGAPFHRGWFVGTFIEAGAARTSDVEIKYWEFPIGPSDPSAKKVL